MRLKSRSMRTTLSALALASALFLSYEEAHPMYGVPNCAAYTYSFAVDNALDSEEGSVENALLFQFSIDPSLSFFPTNPSAVDHYQNCFAELHFRSVTLSFTDMHGFPPGDIHNLRLVEDTDRSMRYEPEHDRVLAHAEIDPDVQEATFILDGYEFPLEDPERDRDRHFFVFADVSDVVPGSGFHIDLKDKGVLIENTLDYWRKPNLGHIDSSAMGGLMHVIERDGKRSRMTYRGDVTHMWHRAGTRPPILSYLLASSFEHGAEREGNIIRSGDSVRFGVRYSSWDERLPERTCVYIGFDGRETCYEMDFIRAYRILDSTAVENHVYKTTIPIIVPPNVMEVTYRFFANDGLDDATGEPVERRHLDIVRDIVIGPLLEPSERERETMLPGETIKLVYPVWHYPRGVALDPDSVRFESESDIRVADAWLRAERRYSQIYDYAELVVLAVLPEDGKVGETFIVPPARLTAEYVDDRTEDGTTYALSSEVPLQLVPARASRTVENEHPFVSIGDSFTMRLTIDRLHDARFLQEPADVLPVAPFERDGATRVLHEDRGAFERLVYETTVRAFVPAVSESGMRVYELPDFSVPVSYEGADAFSIDVPVLPVHMASSLTLGGLAENPPPWLSRDSSALPSALRNDYDALHQKYVTYAVWASALLAGVLLVPPVWFGAAWLFGLPYWHRSLARHRWRRAYMRLCQHKESADLIALRREFQAYVAWLAFGDNALTLSIVEVLVEQVERSDRLADRDKEIIVKNLRLFESLDASGGPPPLTEVVRVQGDALRAL